MNSDILKLIELDAEMEGISLNSKINSYLSKYILYRWIEKEKAGIIAPRTVSFIIDEISIGKWIKEYTGVIVDYLPLLMKANNVEVNPETVKSFLFGGVLKQCGAYDDFHPHKDESGRNTLPLLIIKVLNGPE